MTHVRIQTKNLTSTNNTIKLSPTLQSVDCKCTICYETNRNPTRYFKCIKLHNICNVCYKKNLSVNINADSDRVSKCPTCSAALNNEFKEPAKLTILELNEVITKNINISKIYIHQNFCLQEDTQIMHVTCDKSEIDLITLNGKLLTYLDMFLCQNGFLYKYDATNKFYYLAITKNKYQLWDTQRVMLIL